MGATCMMGAKREFFLLLIFILKKKEHFYHSTVDGLTRAQSSSETLIYLAYRQSLLFLFTFFLFFFLPSIYFFFTSFFFLFGVLSLKYHFHLGKDTLTTSMITMQDLWLASLSLSLSRKHALAMPYAEHLVSLSEALAMPYAQRLALATFALLAGGKIWQIWQIWQTGCTVYTWSS